MSLRLVSREFSYLFRPLLCESISLPTYMRTSWEDTPSYTNCARELLRLIDRDPCLATCIRDLNYYELTRYGLLEYTYSPEQLQHDHRIWSQFAAELAQKSSLQNNFDYSSAPSELHKMSAAYDKTCIPILLVKLPNLRSLTYHGYRGGRNSFLLTPAAREIWKWMPLKSLQVLKWRPRYELRFQYTGSDYEEYKLWTYKLSKKPTNVWEAFSLLRFTPMLQHFQIIDNGFLDIPVPKDLPVLAFLTVIECGSIRDGLDIGQWLLQLLKCTPMLKKIRCVNLGTGYPDATEFQEALRLVRNTIEEIQIDADFKPNYDTTGGIGPFKDFPKLKKISTEIESLVPYPGNLLENFSLLDSLPPNIETLHFTDQRFLEEFQPFGGVNPCPYSNRNYREPMSTFYKLLEDVALAKERGPLKKLVSITMGRRSGDPERRFSEEDTREVAAICKSWGIKWIHEVYQYPLESDETAVGPKWYTDSFDRRR